MRCDENHRNRRRSVRSESFLAAQHLDFGFGVGVKGGFPPTNLLEPGSGSTQLSRNDNYIVGPVGEMRLPFGLAIEGGALYRGTSYDVTHNGGTGTATSVKSASWEFPYLGKFRFPIPLIKPFVVAGGAYRTFTDLPAGITPTHNGVVGGAGLELRIRRFRFSAEGRYLRWGAPPATDLERLRRSQIEVLFGFIF
jgi:hypothetical protein